MDNEKNKIESSNSLKAITNEYHDYNEYNSANYSNREFQEMTSFKEFNDNKSSLKARKYSSIGTKLLSSAMVITLAVVVGTSFIFGPQSVISEVFIEGYENNLFINILFTDYYEEDNLKLVVSNDFTDRVYDIVPYEEGYEEETWYMYSQEVLDLRTDASYNISIISGANILYKESYTITESPITTSIIEADVGYEEQLIYFDLTFDKFSNNDYVLVELVKDEVILESIPVSGLQPDGDLYYFSNSFSVTENGDYYVNVYINDDLEVSRWVNVLEVDTSVTEFNHEYGDLTFYYYLSFDNYSEDEEITFGLYQNDELVYIGIVSDIAMVEENYYTASGEVNDIQVGKYIARVFAEGKCIYEEEVGIGYYVTSISSVELYFITSNIMAIINIDEYDENEELTIHIFSDDVVNNTYDLEVYEYDGSLYSMIINKDGVDSVYTYYYEVCANGEPIIEGSVSRNVLSSLNVSEQYFSDGTESAPSITEYIANSDYIINAIIVDKNNMTYLKIENLSEKMENNLFTYSFEGYEAGEYAFIIFTTDGVDVRVNYWKNFSLYNGG
ncbi:MAG: hypothetical protein J6W25_03585 [Bacilli bacterium]|nr:hypothetical protein [Bacilli bacterium]